jgi:hypothetical protein
LLQRVKPLVAGARNVAAPRRLAGIHAACEQDHLIA